MTYIYTAVDRSVILHTSTNRVSGTDRVLTAQSGESALNTAGLR